MILTRKKAGRIQVYLLKRSAKSGFMAGNFVFPGGTIDAADRDVELFQAHCDLTLDAVALRFGGNLTAAKALAYGVAAIRETLEEAGVFLARNEEDPRQQFEEACQLRLSVNLTKDWFARMVSGTNWRLTLSALSRWSHWLTPELMKRRFDTRFFIADMEIVELETDSLKLTNFGELKSVVSKLVAKRIEGMVVYKLDTSKRKERYASKRIETVEFDAEKDLLIITLGKKR